MENSGAGGVGSYLKQILRDITHVEGADAIRAVLILVAGIIVARLARRWLGAVLGRTRVKNDPLLIAFFLRSLSLAIFLLALLHALLAIGWNPGTFVASLGVTGLLLGIGLRDTLANLASGLLLLIYRPFRAGETIEVDGSQGVVEELTIVNMQMLTNDGVRVIMPNSKVWGAKIVNYSRTERRRMELTLKVREEDIDEAIGVIEAELAVYERVLKNPAPLVRVTSIAGGAATLTIWAWTDPHQFAEALGETYLRVAAGFRQAELPII